MFEAGFAMLSVKALGRSEDVARGDVGALMVKKAETWFTDTAREISRRMRNTSLAAQKQTVRIVVPVISERRDLLDFYQQSGYSPLHNRREEPPEHPDFCRIVNDKWASKVRLCILHKDIDVGKQLRSKLFDRRSPDVIGISSLMVVVSILVGLLFVAMPRCRRDCRASDQESLLSC
eukprot:gnl/TRDRNA2_/TRDRNA2_141103_c2_seq1.p1 gnl/TRDRNA2_/TRDRNA2_141103_c2~~gnl/TRDRNA2_/TRDRNA2_141103_c2_seq1.p1  ORF type:complete len:197 (-),score=22.51 gnl/TRDRNA2_/TRDRNA2_141103_c2_seq1:137-667(-)